MTSPNPIAELVRKIHSGKKFPAAPLVKNNPETAAVVSKLVRGPEQITNRFNLKDRNAGQAVNHSQIMAISENTKQRQQDNENVITLFPDIELAVQILVSSILSPKDMVKTDLIYKAKEPIFPSELLMKLNEVVKTHANRHYDIDNNLQYILREMLFEAGSHVKVVLPESVVDEVINQNRSVSTEALSTIFENTSSGSGQIRSMGFLGTRPEDAKPRTALESFVNSEYGYQYNQRVTSVDPAIQAAFESVDVVDNFHVLKLPDLVKLRNRKIAKQIIRSHSKASASMESFDNKRITADQLSDMTFKHQNAETQMFVSVPNKHNAKRKSVGRPLVMTLPAESVIPIHVPGNERSHIGYFVLIDQDGNPVTRKSNRDNLDGLSSNIGSQSQSRSLSSMLIAKAKKNLTSSENQPTLDQITSVYGSIVEDELMKRLAGGIYGSNVKIANVQEIYRIMLARSLASKYTRLLFLPQDLVTYFAFKYFPNGVGKSYLDDIKNLTSLRAILLFSKVMAQVKSSINVTHVNITLDEKDPSPMETIELAQNEVVKMRQQYFPLGINTPSDITDWLQRAGLEFSFEGHPGLPQTKFDFETKNLEHTSPNDDLMEDLRKQTYMAFGLSPETVDNGFNTEFATTAIANNILFSKRVLQFQEGFCGHLTDYLRKIVTNDEVILDELRTVLKEHHALIEKTLSDDEKQTYTEDESRFTEDAMERFIENFEVDLPKPDVTSLHDQSEAFNEYSEALEKALDSWISSEMMASEVAGEINQSIDSIKNVIKAYYLRRWMSENGYLTELNDIVTADEDGKPTIDIYEQNRNHLQGLMRSSLQFLKKMKLVKTAADKDLATLNVDGSGADSGSSDDSTSADDGSGGADDFGGGDDFGGDLGMDVPGGEEPPAEEEPPAATEDETADKDTPVE